jgi:hypothetical protein
VKQFGLRLEPISHIIAKDASTVLKNLEGTPGDGIVDFRYRIG